MFQCGTFKTQEDVDLVEVWDTGSTMKKSQYAATLSGDLTTPFMINSQNNYITLNMVSDTTEEGQGFSCTWEASEFFSENATCFII